MALKIHIMTISRHSLQRTTLNAVYKSFENVYLIHILALFSKVYIYNLPMQTAQSVLCVCSAVNNTHALSTGSCTTRHWHPAVTRATGCACIWNKAENKLHHLKAKVFVLATDF